jgi:hypothetical protein
MKDVPVTIYEAVKYKNWNSKNSEQQGSAKSVEGTLSRGGAHHKRELVTNHFDIAKW